MIHHLILQSADQDLHLEGGFLRSGERRLALDTLSSVQCLADRARWSQAALESLAGQCPVILARWQRATKKWSTVAVTPRARYVQPTAIYHVCRLSPQPPRDN